MALTRLLPLDAAAASPHRLHADDRIWTETNCYVDVWIEVLHALGVDPVPAAAFAVASDFEGDQWTFFKFPPEDLRALYGIRVFEMNPWRPLVDHVVEHLEAGRLITVEADSWYLPDTAGVSYRLDHQKSTIVPNAVDVHARRLGYFHNASYFELDGDDFDGVFRLGDAVPVGTLPPYVETVRLDAMEQPAEAEVVARSRELLALHVGRMPHDNPIRRMQQRTLDDLPWLREAGLDGFHRWAFGTFRQCGASAEIAAAYLDWLAPFEDDTATVAAASDAFRRVAQGCKSLEFSLARLARGRTVDTGAAFDDLAEAWGSARDLLVARRD